MKGKDLTHVLRAYAQVPFSQAKLELLKTLAAIFDTYPAATVTAALKRLSKLPSTPTTSGSSCKEAAALLTPLRAIFSAAGRGLPTKDISSLVSFLDARGYTDLAALRASPADSARATRGAAGKAAFAREDVVQGYVNRLQNSVGSDAWFPTVYQALLDDADLTAAELSAVAKRVAFSTAKTKADALKKILAHHQKLRAIHAKNRATAGRTAA